MTRLPPERVESMEEALADIYELQERGPLSTVDAQRTLDQAIRPGILEDLKKENFITVDRDRVQFSPGGETLAVEVIRRKRLAERLLKDVLNVKDEFIDPAACQWEHTLSREVTDSICTLLGHPTQSPRNFPIPQGRCCQSATRSVAPVVRPLTELRGGERARITYLLLNQYPDLHRLLSMGLNPGTEIRVMQTFPTFVVEVHETQLAFDESVAAGILVHPLPLQQSA